MTPNNIPHSKMLLNDRRFHSFQKEMVLMLEGASGKKGTGLVMGIVLQQVHYSLVKKAEAYREESNPEARKLQLLSYRGERWWVFDTYKDWQAKQFPWWTERTIANAFRSLEEVGILVSTKFESHRGCHRKWYTIDYGRLEGFVEENRAKVQALNIDMVNFTTSSGKVSPFSESESSSESVVVGSDPNESPPPSSRTGKEAICPKHNTPMKLRTNGETGEEFYSHRKKDGSWCDWTLDDYANASAAEATESAEEYAERTGRRIIQ